MKIIVHHQTYHILQKMYMARAQNCPNQLLNWLFGKQAASEDIFLWKCKQNIKMSFLLFCFKCLNNHEYEPYSPRHPQM